MFRSLILLVALFVAAACGSGCAPYAGVQEAFPMHAPLTTEWDAPLTDRPYRIQVGDRLSVRFFYAPELSDEVVVRPDGRISLVPVDDVDAAGLTPSELDKALTAQFATVVNRPDLSVIVREFAAQRAFVGGEVTTPQMIELSSNMSVFTAIMQAGGPRPSGALENVLLIRRGEDNKCYVRKVNVRQVLKKGAGDIRLAAYDVVYVPRTIIADVGQFVDQYINRIVPRSLGFTFLYNVNNNEVQITD